MDVDANASCGGVGCCWSGGLRDVGSVVVDVDAVGLGVRCVNVADCLFGSSVTVGRSVLA